MRHFGNPRSGRLKYVRYLASCVREVPCALGEPVVRAGNGAPVKAGANDAPGKAGGTGAPIKAGATVSLGKLAAQQRMF